MQETLVWSLGWEDPLEKCYPLQYSRLENSMDCIVHGVTKSRTWLSDFRVHFFKFTAILYFFSLHVIMCIHFPPPSISFPGLILSVCLSLSRTHTPRKLSFLWLYLLPVFRFAFDSPCFLVRYSPVIPISTAIQTWPQGTPSLVKSFPAFSVVVDFWISDALRHLKDWSSSSGLADTLEDTVTQWPRKAQEREEKTRPFHPFQETWEALGTHWWNKVRRCFCSEATRHTHPARVSVWFSSACGNIKKSQTGALNSICLSLMVLEVQKSKTKVLIGLVPPDEGPHSSLQTAIFLLCLPLAER